MAKVEDLIKSIPDSHLRDEIAREVANLKSQKKFGLVFEEHLPEQVLLPGLPIKPGARVVKGGAENEIFTVIEPESGSRKTLRFRVARESDGQEETLLAKELIVIKKFGEPIYPTLVPVDRVTRAPGKPYHTLINAENFHALQLLLYCYEGQVDVIYIDPPYNTGARDWKYNNDYVDKNDQFRHSKWLSMMKRRLLLAKRLLRRDGVICVAIDDYESHRLLSVMDEVFGTDNHLGTVVVRSKPQGRATLKGFSVTHEYAVFYGRSDRAFVHKLEKTGRQKARYSNQDTFGLFTWENFRKTGQGCRRIDRPKQFFPIYCLPDGSLTLTEMNWNDDKKKWDIVEEPNLPKLLPVTADGEERVWKWGVERTLRELRDLRIVETGDGKEIQKKLRMLADLNLPFTIWDEPEMSASEQGTKDIMACFGNKDFFSFPKSKYAVRKCILSATSKKNALILDFFAGSGTTLHATCLLNAEDDGNRQCILVTNNEVNERQTRELHGQGYWPGDSKFEQHGIAESVTWPRCKYVINGKRDDGTALIGVYLDGRKMKEGFEENAEFFKLDFLDPNEVAYGERLEAIIPILWLIAGTHGDLESKRVGTGSARWLIPKQSPYAVLIQEDHFAQFKRELKGRPDITHVFLVTDSEEAYREMIAELPGSPKTKMLYKSYLENFRINTERNL